MATNESGDEVRTARTRHPLACAWVAAALIATCRLATHAQQQPTPEFRATADLVEVDAVVQDNHGRFVPNLTADDFVLLDEGQRRRVQLMTLVRRRTRAAPQDTNSPDAPTGRTHSAEAQTAEARRGVFVVFFDGDHLSPGGFKRVQAGARALVSSAFTSGDLGGIVLDGRMANDRLTTDRDELLTIIDQARPSGKLRSRFLDENDWPRMTETEAIRYRVDNDNQAYRVIHDRACAERPEECTGRNDVKGQIDQKATRVAQTARLDSETTLAKLAAVFNGLGRFGGRKTVLLLTEGFVARQSWPMVQQALTMAARADAVVYTLDARGLDSKGVGDRLAGTDPGPPSSYAALLAQEDQQADAVNSLAVDTGGFVVRNANDFGKAIAQISAEAGTYYVLGFQPETPDGRFHRISVRVTRPGLTVRARRGYVATARPLPAIASAAQPIAPAALPGRTGVEPAPRLPPEQVAAGAGPQLRTAAPSSVGGVRLRPDAVQHASALAANAPADADATAGWSAYQRGDMESAQSSLKTAAARPTAKPWVSYALGQSDYALGSYQDAASAWERVREAAPEFEPVYFDLVDAYLQLKDYDRAVRVMHAAGRRWPDDAEVLNALGVVQVARNVLDDAVKSFGEAIAKAPGDGTGYFNLARALELRYRQSRRWVAVVHTWRANEHDRDAAIENYKRYLEIGGPFETAARDGLERLDWKQ